MSKNKLRTTSYFIKRLRDNGFIVIKLFAIYCKSDPRQWTIMVNPSDASVMITCYANRDDLNEILFEIDDGGKKIPKNFYIKTNSIEVIISYLINHGVTNNMYKGSDRFLSKRLNNYDEEQKIPQSGKV